MALYGELFRWQLTFFVNSSWILSKYLRSFQSRALRTFITFLCSYDLFDREAPLVAAKKFWRVGPRVQDGTEQDDSDDSAGILYLRVVMGTPIGKVWIYSYVICLTAKQKIQWEDPI